MATIRLSCGNLRYLRTLVLTFSLLAFQANASFIDTVDATNPLAFWTLDTVEGTSQVNGYTTTYNNRAGEVSTTGSPSSEAASLDGNNSNPQYVSTSRSGGITGTGS